MTFTEFWESLHEAIAEILGLEDYDEIITTEELITAEELIKEIDLKNHED